MALTGEQVDDLRKLLCSAFTARELEQLVRTTLGDRLYEEYAPQGLSGKDLCFELIEALERRGTTVVLLRGVLKARSARADVRETLARVCPEALRPAPDPRDQLREVVGGVDAAKTRLADPAVAAMIVGYRPALERTVAEIDLLARYKALHDCLHMVQLKHYRQVSEAARRFRADPLAFGTLDGYLAELRVIADEARSAAEGLPAASGGRRQEELAWVQELEAVVAGLRAALDGLEDRAASDAVRKLKGLLRVEPFRINRLLALTAEQLPLDRVVEALDEVLARTAANDPAAAVLRGGSAALRAVIPLLMGRVTEHTRWQKIENDLWQAEESLHRGGEEDLEEFRFLWPAIKDQADHLCAVDPAAEWAATLGRYAAAFDEAFPPPPAAVDVARARATFNRFRHEAMFHFYLVDKALRALCGEVTAVGRPLAELIQEVPDVGR